MLDCFAVDFAESTLVIFTRIQEKSTDAYINLAVVLFFILGSRSQQ